MNSGKLGFRIVGAVLWIRIRIGSGFNGVPRSGSGLQIWIRIQEGKNGPEKYKKVNKFVF
jgi:hypothetical protein